MKNNLRSKKEHFINTLQLGNQLELVLTTPWEKRHELIIASEKAADLVAAMPVEELFWTIKATGIEDSAPILNLSTPEQLQFVFDLDFWQKDKLRPDKIAAWFLIMLELSRESFEIWLKWILKKDPWFFPAIFNEFLTVVKRPDDMDIQEAKDKLPGFTLDNVYYISFKKEKLSPLFANIITYILGIDAGYYRDIFETMLWETPSINLETAYRFRCGRIGDFGIPDYYESLDIYTPLEIGQMHKRAFKSSPVERLPINLELPAFVPTLYISEFPMLETAIKKLAGQPLMEHIIREITGVSNKILMVDMPDLDEPHQLRQALNKAFCLLNLGIEYLSNELNQNPEEILSSYFIEEIVRLSNKFLIPLANKARNLIQDKGYWALPHHLKPILEEASKRPPYIFIDEGKTRPVMTLNDVEIVNYKILLAELWKEILYFLDPPFENWENLTKWKKTNILSKEEFSVDMALSTATANLLIFSKFKIKPLTLEDLKKLRQQLIELKEKEELYHLILDLLTPIFDSLPKEKRKLNLITTVIENITNSFYEIIKLNKEALSESKYITNLLTIS